MKKTLRATLVASIMFLSACAAKTGFEPYQVHGAVEADGAKRYLILPSIDGHPVKRVNYATEVNHDKTKQVRKISESGPQTPLRRVPG